MLKNIRTAFHDYGTLIDSNDENIEWKYILDIVDIQSDEGLHIANKLKKKHVKYRQNIMNGRLATQTLSNSVKDSLLYLKNSKTYGHIFKNSEPTGTFCKRINDAFDMLNVRTRYPKGFQTHKILLNSNNRENLKRHVTEITDYIIGLKIKVIKKNRKTKLTRTETIPILKSRRKCGFVGMIICLKNMFDLFDDLQKKYNQEYILTYKLLQDHLEKFFSAIRIKGGFNNNPDGFQQFRCAYRKLLLHHDVVSSRAANCEADNVPILAVSYKKTTQTKVFDESILMNYE